MESVSSSELARLRFNCVDCKRDGVDLSSCAVSSQRCLMERLDYGKERFEREQLKKSARALMSESSAVQPALAAAATRSSGA